MDVVAIFRGDRSLPWPPQLPIHRVLSETLRLAAAERLGFPQLAKGLYAHFKTQNVCWFLCPLRNTQSAAMTVWMIIFLSLRFVFVPSIFTPFTIIPPNTCLLDHFLSSCSNTTFASSFFLLFFFIILPSPVQICENYGPNLDTCPEGTVLGLLVDANSCLHLYVNGMDQGVAAQDIPSPCYPFIDLYGQCEQVCKHMLPNAQNKLSCLSTLFPFCYLIGNIYSLFLKKRN